MVADQRHRRRHGHRNAVAHLRAVLHDQGNEGHGPRPRRRSTASSSRAADTSGSTAKWGAARHSRSTCRAWRRRAKPPRSGRTGRVAEAGTRHRNHPAGRGREPTCVILPVRYLEKQGYKVIEAADGAVAMQIAVAHEEVIHLLLTDVIMPGMNGRELAQRISEIRPNVKILYMSGYTENVIGHNGMLDAGVRLLQKPFNLRDLKSKVREVLDATPTPPEVAMSTQLARTKPSRPREGSSSHARATIPASFAAALSPSRRESLARRHHRKHQPVGHALPGRRSPAAQLATGN